MRKIGGRDGETCQEDRIVDEMMEIEDAQTVEETEKEAKIVLGAEMVQEEEMIEEMMIEVMTEGAVIDQDLMTNLKMEIGSAPNVVLIILQVEGSAENVVNLNLEVEQEDLQREMIGELEAVIIVVEEEDVVEVVAVDKEAEVMLEMEAEVVGVFHGRKIGIVPGVGLLILAEERIVSNVVPRKERVNQVSLKLVQWMKPDP